MKDEDRTYVESLLKWQADVAAYVTSEIKGVMGARTQSGDNGPPPPPPKPTKPGS